jgi:Fe-S oxidoreductase
MFGPELVQAFREFKLIWDPDGGLNPGKVVDPYPLDSNLRMDPSYRSRQVKTEFRYPGADGGSFTAAAERCFGVGACRDQNAVMCPSYQATLEEKHSTRGRARLLFEMLREDSPLDGGWRNEEVREALDLCLACKGCLHECPVRVDMATYKAEFLSHYWKRRVRPRQAYALGLIPWGARVASRFPRVANRVAASAAAKRLAGVAPERTPPAFAPRPFTDWFRSRSSDGRGRAAARRVVLWPDTFNNYFHPQVAIAATSVLEDAGFEVVVPDRPVCCGRPLYDYGMLNLARRQLRQTLSVLRPEIEAGTPVVALEPSCGAVFRNELINMYPADEDAKRLCRQTVSIGELLAGLGDEWDAPTLERHALVHLHCHQRATSDTDCDVAVLDRLGVRHQVLDTGCCGMAGSFGYEAGEKYRVSMEVGELHLLPAVRAAPDHTLLVTDGFSCRSQIAHGSDRGALHLAQVVQMAAQTGPNGPTAGKPEEHSL